MVSPTKKKSCVIIVENLPLPLDRRVWQEATALREDGWDVSIICPRTEKFPEAHVEINGVNIYRHPLQIEASHKIGYLAEYATALWHELRLLVTVYRKHGFTVIQACNPPDIIFLVTLPFRLLGKKFVFDHHDICPELFAVKFGRKGALYNLLLFFEKMTYKAADRVITANETFKQLTCARTGKAADKVTAVYSVPDSVNIRRIDPDPALKGGRRLLVGYIGIIGSQDGVDHLVRALAHLKTRTGVTDVRAIIIGDGPDLPAIRMLAADLGLTDDITFTGYLSGEPLLRALSTIDIGIIPDPYNEYNDKISMNKVFEYSKLGIPIVSYPLTETRRLLEDAVVVANGHDPQALGEAVVKLLDDDLRRDMAQRAKALSERKFSWEHEKRTYVSVMNSLID